MGKRYKLLRDLPNAKAGEIFDLTEKGSLIFQGSGESAGVFYKKEEVIVFDLLNPDKGWFEKIEEKKYCGRAPKEGNRYWYIFGDGSIGDDFWNGMRCDVDRFESGSAFWTKEEAEKELERRKAYVILKEDTKGFKPDWKDSDEKKYFVIYDWGDNKLMTEYCWMIQDVAGLYFATRKDAEASIMAHEKEWKTWLGVEV